FEARGAVAKKIAQPLHHFPCALSFVLDLVRKAVAALSALLHLRRTRVITNCRQRLMQLVRERSRHLACCGKPQRTAELGLLLGKLPLDCLAARNVARDRDSQLRSLAGDTN